MRPEPFYDAGGIISLIKSPPFWPASKNPPVGDFTDFPVQRKQPHSVSLRLYKFVVGTVARMSPCRELSVCFSVVGKGI